MCMCIYIHIYIYIYICMYKYYWGWGLAVWPLIVPVARGAGAPASHNQYYIESY